jgi:hypothetical protein
LLVHPVARAKILYLCLNSCQLVAKLLADMSSGAKDGILYDANASNNVKSYLIVMSDTHD